QIDHGCERRLRVVIGGAQPIAFRDGVTAQHRQHVDTARVLLDQGQDLGVGVPHPIINVVVVPLDPRPRTIKAHHGARVPLPVEAEVGAPTHQVAVHPAVLQCTHPVTYCDLHAVSPSSYSACDSTPSTSWSSKPAFVPSRAAR